MAREQDIKAVAATHLIIGLSSILGFSAYPGQIFANLKQFSGGSLEIGGASLTWGQGYQLSTAEILSINCSGRFFLAATGATAIAHLLIGKSAGFEE